MVMAFCIRKLVIPVIKYYYKIRTTKEWHMSDQVSQQEMKPRHEYICV